MIKMTAPVTFCSLVIVVLGKKLEEQMSLREMAASMPSASVVTRYHEHSSHPPGRQDTFSHEAGF